MINTEVLIAAMLVLVTTIILVVDYLYQKKRWNNGICKKTGKYWILMSKSSQGVKMYQGNNTGGPYLRVCYAFKKK